MVRDYTRKLYTPAAVNGRALNDDYAGAATLAAWKKKVKGGWTEVRVEHVESGGVGDAPEVGDKLSVRAFVALGALTPDDVDVQVVYGVIDADDTLVGTTTESLAPAEEYDGGRLRFDGTVTLDHSGGFGYTVRVIPKNSLLASTAELGVVALP
jgi:starch phosphorylase